MGSTIRIVEGQLEISPAGSGEYAFRLSVDEWRALNKTVESEVLRTFISYDDACDRLAIHRSTLGDRIARGILERVLIDGRGFIDARTLPTPGSDPQSNSRRAKPAAPGSPNTDPSLAAQAIIRVLTNHENAVAPGRFPADVVQASQPGMYSWWGDDAARSVLGDALGVALPSLLYVGQAGATKRRSGRKSAATLASRIERQHLRGNISSSTFRLTVSTLLADSLSLTPTRDGKLDAASNIRVSAWIADHLRVAIAPFSDRDSLGELESTVLAHLSPPLNLEHCPPSEARARLSLMRRAIRSGVRS